MSKAAGMTHNQSYDGRSRARVSVPVPAAPLPDPRYRTSTVRHDLAALGLFKGIEQKLVKDADGVATEAPFMEAFLFDSKPVGVSRVDITKLTAIQPYYTEENIARLQELPKSERPLPKVFNYDGKAYLIDGTHRALVTVLEGSRTMDAEIYEVPG